MAGDSTIGRGVIQLEADATKLNAAINDAKRSIKSLGDSAGAVSKGQSASIDRYVRSLQTSAAVQGRTTRETELYKLALRGATDEQLRAANSALKLSEAYQRGEVIGGRIRIGLLAIAAASVAAGAASIALFNASAKSIDGFNDLKDATGASIENISALDDLARRTGATFETVETSLIKFNAALKDTKPDSDAALAFEAIGLSIKELRELDPAEAFRRTAVALAGFADDGNKARLAQELFGKSLKEVAPLLKDLSEKGQLVATVTTAQAEAAETYRKNIFALEANIGNLARSLTNDLIPSLNNAFVKAQQFSTIGNFFASFGQEIKANLASDKLRTVTADIESLQKTIDRQGGDPQITKKMAALRAEATGLIRDASSASEELKRLSGGPPTPIAADDSQNKAESARLARVPKPSVEIREKKGGGGGGSGAGSDPAAREAEQVRRAELDDDLRFLRDKLSEERATISFNERERQALYQAGNASLREFYAERKSEIARGVQSELNLLTDEQARLEVELGRVKDPSDRIRLQAQLDESLTRSGNVAVEAARAARIGTLEEEAAFKQLNDTVTDYRANLLQLQGDEEGASRLRAQQAIEQARVLARQSGGEISAQQVDAYRLATEQQLRVNAAKNASSAINERLQMQEERIALAQKSGAITEIAALQQIGVARTASIAAAEAQVKALEQLAAERPLDIQVNLDAERARLELDKLYASLDPLKDKFDEVFRDAGSGAITDFLNGTKTAKEALKSFGKEILGSINATTGKQLSEQLFGKEGMLGGAGKFVADLFPKSGDQIAASKQKDSGFLSKLLPQAPPDAIKPQIDTSAVTASLSSLQTAGIDPASIALGRLQQAADGAASALGKAKAPAAEIGAEPDGFGEQILQPPPSGQISQPSGEQSIADLFKDPADQSVNLSTALADSGKTTKEFTAASSQAISAISSLAGAGSTASAAMALLPSIINAISAASATTSSAGGGSGWIKTIFNLAASAYGSSSGMATNNTGTSLPTSGGRAMGGPVMAGSIQPITERGPEILRVGSQQYLMMGSQPGYVTPNGGGAAGGQAQPIMVSNNFTINGPSDRRSEQQIAAAAGGAVARAIKRGR